MNKENGKRMSGIDEIYGGGGSRSASVNRGFKEIRVRQEAYDLSTDLFN